MNDRIKELVLFARQFAMDQKNQYQRIHNTEMCMEDYREIYNMKFAELIVKECIDVLNPEGDLTSMREEYGRLQAMRMIKKHFGVE